MTQTFDLTDNEFRAAMAIVKDCLNGMGGSRPSDLAHDEYTWTDAKVLMAAGWNKNEATGTFGALMEKGVVSEYDRNEWVLTTSAWEWLDTKWDEFNLNKEMETEMTCVTIDIANLTVEFWDSAIAAQTHAETNDYLFVGKPEDLIDLSGPQMVALYNATCDRMGAMGGMAPDHVKRFSGKDAGIKRIMANLLDLWELTREKAKTQPKAEKPSKPAKPQKAAGDKPRRNTGINLPPLKKVYACREGSKQAILVDMLSRVQGASMQELLEALSGGTKPWKEVSVKSGLNWDMNKIKGYGIRTTQRINGEDAYHLVMPKGMDRPLPHTPRKGAK